MRVGSLFAGIGGFDEAFRRAGFDLAWHVEWDEACQRVLERRFGGDVLAGGTVGLSGISDSAEPAHRTPGRDPRGTDRGPLLFSDVREVGAHNLPAVDVLVGGWPCQPVSVAGKRAASSDERDMWPEFARIAGELRPAWVVGENVPGALSAEGGRYFRRVVDDLTQLGYGVCWRTLDAQHFGVPQRRRRVFVVGCLGDLRSAVQVLLEPEGGSRNPEESRAEGPFTPEGTSRRIAYALKSSGDSQAEDHDTYVAATLNPGGNNGGFRSEPGAHLVTSPLLSHRRGVPSAEEADQLIAHTLRAEGHDASEDGTGRGTPIIAAPLTSGGSPNSNAPGRRKEDDVNLAVIPFDTTQITSDKNYSNPQPGDPCHRMARGAHGLGVGRPTQAVGFYTTGGAQGTGVRPDEDVSPSLKVGSGLENIASSVSVDVVMAVRRLTPVECERLQGFPDGWTDLPQPDSTRYRQLGNAVAVPVVEWIARRLKDVAG